MQTLPILEFRPLLKEVVWGGRRLGAVIGKELKGDRPFGESWEVVDLASDQSIVSGGPLEGRSLESLCFEFREQLLGGVELLEGRFPLLFKFIDASDRLSLQVHPDEEACARIGQGARPKTEAWYVVDCEPGSSLFIGLKAGVGADDLVEAVKSATLENLLNEIRVNPGNLLFLPAGTVHAIGSGILLAEVQQSSNTTYRVSDWGRVGLSGRPRQLHLEQALKSIRFDAPGMPEGDPPGSGRSGISCDSFEMEVVTSESGEKQILEGVGPLILMGVGGEGEVVVSVGEETAELRLGRTLMIPAQSAGRVALEFGGISTVLAVRPR